MSISEKAKELILILSFILCVVMPHSVYASEESNSSEKAVVFLLDASGSMKANDPHRYAIDSIAQLIYTLPSNYEVGFVAYNTEVCASQELLDNSQRENIMVLAKTVRYADYSNAGAGLAKAVDVLSSSKASEKSIVMLSDGEFLMQDEARSAQSYEQYRVATERAAQGGIKIHVIGLGKDMENTGNSIFQASSNTGGGAYFSPQALNIQEAIDAILDRQLEVRQLTAAIVDADGGVETVSVALPFSYASTVRVLLTSNSPIKNLKTNFKADGAKQINGERYSFLELQKPQSEQLELSFSGTAGNQVHITLIPEYKAIARTEVTYEDREPMDGQKVRYDRTAAITYTFYDAENESIQLWTENYFDHSKILVQGREGVQEIALEGGKGTVYRSVAEGYVEKVEVDGTGLPVNVLGISAAELKLEEAPLLVKESETPYILYGGLALSVLVIAVIFAWMLKRSRQRPIPAPEEEERPEPGKASYVGKLNLYITRAPSGYDIQPLCFDLFRLPSSRVISISEVLESCGVKERFEGAERIYFNSGQGRSLVLTNQSDCCIMKSGEILMKKKSYQLFEESKIDILFEDEVSELTLQYKGLKPSQMR